MQVTVNLSDGYIPDKYSKYSQIKQSDQPIVSLPFKVTDLPEATKYLAATLIDYDAVERTGSPFIHWLISDIPVAEEIPADLSRNFDGPQGKNSWSSRFYDFNDEYVINHYAGPVPPDKVHHYTLKVYALKDYTNLKNGFYYNQFLDAVNDETIASAEIKLPGKN